MKLFALSVFLISALRADDSPSRGGFINRSETTAPSRAGFTDQLTARPLREGQIIVSGGVVERAATSSNVIASITGQGDADGLRPLFPAELAVIRYRLADRPADYFCGIVIKKGEMTLPGGRKVPIYEWVRTLQQ